MVADIFDALTAEMPSKKPIPLEKVFEIMQGDRGVFFDPVLLDLFMANRARLIRIKDEFGEPAATDGRPDHADKLLFAECPFG
jgi:response regulator RpfG family c-di-GMP phosphodiesterase